MTIFHAIFFLTLLLPVGWHGLHIAGPVGAGFAIIGWFFPLLACLGLVVNQGDRCARWGAPLTLAAFVAVPVACFFVPPIVRVAVIGGVAALGLAFIVIAFIGAEFDTRRRQRRLSKGCCGDCGYDLTTIDMDARCPECGLAKRENR